MPILLPVVQPENLLFWRGLTKLGELVSNPFVFVYTIKYVQFNSIKKNFDGLKCKNNTWSHDHVCILNIWKKSKFTFKPISFNFFLQSGIGSALEISTAIQPEDIQEAMRRYSACSIGPFSSHIVSISIVIFLPNKSFLNN